MELGRVSVMRTFAVLLSILIIAWLALRLRPAVRQRVFGIERGAAVRVGRRFVAVRVQIGGAL